MLFCQAFSICARGKSNEYILIFKDFCFGPIPSIGLFGRCTYKCPILPEPSKETSKKSEVSNIHKAI